MVGIDATRAVAFVADDFVGWDGSIDMFVGEAMGIMIVENRIRVAGGSGPDQAAPLLSDPASET